MTRIDRDRRLEPIRPGTDLERGFRAEIADPAWFLARQWHLGEHQGEDAASPVNVSYRASHDAINSLDGTPATDPAITPAEAIIESEPQEWWTAGRRIRIGMAARQHVPAAHADDLTLQLAGLPVPYDRLDGTGYDGLALYLRRMELRLPEGVFASVPAIEPADFWNPSELNYSAKFSSGDVALSVPKHDGGDVDWFSVTADGPLVVPVDPPKQVDALPTRLKYPGAPHPRWWQIENAHVDIGGFPPDRSHFATMLLIDLVVSHADDWFSFPIEARAGTVVTLNEVTVRNSFDEDETITPPTDWSLFKVAGLAPASLAIWPTAVSPLSSRVVDEVIVGVDEDANVLWAIEQRAAGKELAPPPPTEPPPAGPGEVLGSLPATYTYRAGIGLRRYWHPYEIQEVDGRRVFVQGRLADLDVRPPALMPAPVSPLLLDPAAPASGPVHRIEPSAVPVTGLRLHRQWMLARRTDGLPVLWMQRRRLPLVGPPVSGLRFDALEQEV
ncbi:hypothetical protein OG558_23955 [Kribbella sp. NBC_01510]|uniref:hypothetical protein n=1 Tax=Kribbella sp. NBC_01510 TaxID=2903581 RepID=UPI003863F450